jgi:hypothetical protein
MDVDLYGKQNTNKLQTPKQKQNVGFSNLIFLNFKEKKLKKKFVLKWKVIKILTAMEIPRRAKRKAEKETSTNRGTSTERPTTTSRGSWRIWRLKSLKMKKKNVRTAKQFIII